MCVLHHQSKTFMWRKRESKTMKKKKKNHIHGDERQFDWIVTIDCSTMEIPKKNNTTNVLRCVCMCVDVENDPIWSLILLLLLFHAWGVIVRYPMRDNRHRAYHRRVRTTRGTVCEKVVCVSFLYFFVIVLFLLLCRYFFVCAFLCFRSWDDEVE